MREFSAIDLTGAAPSAICPECAKGGLLHAPTNCEIAYCSHGLRGAYRAAGREWTLIRGIELEHFRAVVARGLVAGELRGDLEIELRRMLTDQARDATKH